MLTQLHYTHYHNLIFLNFILIILGIFGFFLYSTHYIFFLICNEIILFGLILQLLLLGSFFNDITPQIFVLFILLIASAEVVIAFSVILRYYRLTDAVYVYPVYYVTKKNNKNLK